MSVTLPDIKTFTNCFINLNEASGIPVGTDIIIQNKQLGAVWVQICASQPADNNTDGFLLIGDFCCIIEDEVEPVWVRSENSNRVSVQIVRE